MYVWGEVKIYEFQSAWKVNIHKNKGCRIAITSVRCELVQSTFSQNFPNKTLSRNPPSSPHCSRHLSSRKVYFILFLDLHQDLTLDDSIKITFSFNDTFWWFSDIDSLNAVACLVVTKITLHYNLESSQATRWSSVSCRGVGLNPYLIEWCRKQLSTVIDDYILTKKPHYWFYRICYIHRPADIAYVTWHWPAHVHNESPGLWDSDLR